MQLKLYCCPSLVPVAIIKHDGDLERKRFVLSYLVTVHYWGKPGQKLKAGPRVRNQRRDHRGTLLTVLLSFLCSATGFIQSRSSSPGMSHQSFMENIIQRTISRNQFINWDLCFPVMSRFVSIWQQITSTSLFFFLVTSL